MKVLYIAEIVGKTGIVCVKKLLPELRRRYDFDFAVANADGVTGGAGLGKNHAGYMRKLGIDVLTGGDCIFYKKDLVGDLDSVSYVLRPANLPPESPGRGSKICGSGSERLAVISLLGSSGFPRMHADNPFATLDVLVQRLRVETPYIFVDFHAALTAEKQAFAAHADGKVSAVVGSHGRVQTADERILSGGTAAITDAGRTGSVHSVGGLCAKQRIAEYMSGIPGWIHENETEIRSPELQGVFFTFTEEGRAESAERIKLPVEGDL